ncbi:Organic hydroperoxide resistance transcriptional regulator [bioreactor metagenome]|jgi:DNA-binding MarR family transcriptional regulator|uniref:Organic hydroperoxide resistance transcriptional regulator n=1 Tax=bioreactor metagenome TaxID=1076179 RepID=A0A644UZB0_9ZZZZ|nr:MarR family transcriptional regulator [Paludibacter sp.]
MAYEQLKLENQLCFPFYATSRLIIRAYQEDLDALGITYPQYLVMMVLWEEQETTVNQIAEKLILNTNTITPLLKRMETMGLITRTPSKTDQRKVMVGLTEEGKNMREKAAEIPSRLLQRLKIDPTEESLQDFLNMKKQLNALIDLLKRNT